MQQQLGVAALLSDSALRFPDHVAVVEGETRVTYRQLWDDVLRCAAALRARGVRPGDRVALMLPNIALFPRVYYAIIAAGASVVPIHALLVADEVEFVLRHSGSVLAVSGGPLWPTALAAAEAAGIPVLEADHEQPGEPSAAAHPTAADDIAAILYTSGTTGRPKGARLTHLNLVLNATVCAQDLHELGPEDVVLGCLPLFHSYGQTCAMNAALRAGATLVLMPRFDPADALDLIVREGVSVFMGVPTMFHALAEAASGRTMPSLRLAVSGGAALPVAVLERFETAFGAHVFEGYGLTETSPAATFNQRVLGRRPGTVGHAIRGVEVAVAAADVEARIDLLPVGTVGEVVIRGHNVFAGYLDDPEATAAAIVDGWFRTGDLGVVDEDGFLSIVDRKKDLVIRGGYNVYPREVEEVLARHPAIAQVAVYGAAHEALGEEVHAAVVLRPAPTGTPAPTPEELIAWSREHLGRHKYPRVIRPVDALPLGPTGKILKRALRESLPAAAGNAEH
ncbi:long-chain fatty acid--CoA ligase [Embleya sp. NPDC127516]|uniref:long-chain-fatty-acid--CoA ligase n=1 Tax=Embleya sp. NPDC127516 TaxID=3363990 RepID=UPI00380A3D56